MSVRTVHLAVTHVPSVYMIGTLVAMKGRVYTIERLNRDKKTMTLICAAIRGGDA